MAQQIDGLPDDALAVLSDWIAQAPALRQIERLALELVREGDGVDGVGTETRATAGLSNPRARSTWPLPCP